MDEVRAFFNQIEEHLMKDEKPSVFLEESRNRPEMRSFPFVYLKRLEDVEQSPVHHPEGNVWNHTMLVVDQAARRREKSENPRAFMWAALLHDIGKAVTTRLRKGRITAYDHDKAGEKLAVEFLKACGQEEAFIRAVSALVRWHMQALFVINHLPFAEIEKMKSQVSIREIGLLALCDRLGRPGRDEAREEENIRLFMEKCNSVPAKR
ncbi:MAG TPA: HDIG domain-containing protein [Thermoclostridium caenicola]|mgnify:FL=1|uniref:HDIG domain-containing protein n=1 Tax=Thermoclostridium caenicola TaxID=659425 RepID=A0A1M6B1V7_9FIRM|nr:HD domain-containing protein [Thermoclostridium caenicola]SHI42695.1 HDIG domain-containing protein [Thermoclostridium caenicola]HOK43996.1 HDIG domain-containing protein [Thermoclostridium caenicola]HOL84709.1 HDIG domain-containing protein [Thermoclostridium caenicola]HPO77360.1 HDIG domain-containing protein [Thermoclostridium caenicola]